MLEIRGIVTLMSDESDFDGSGGVVDRFWTVNVGCTLVVNFVFIICVLKRIFGNKMRDFLELLYRFFCRRLGMLLGVQHGKKQRGKG
jgi:hypothetical protein